MEDVLIPLIIFSFIAFIVKMSLDYKREKNRLRYGAGAEASSSDGSGSLKASELKALIREAVIEASEPLQERLDEVEARLIRAERPALRVAAPPAEPVEESPAHREE